MDDAPENIDRFNLTTLAVLNKLYGSFPTPIQLDAGDVAFGVLPEDADQERAFNFGAEAHHVVTWLAEEGFLRYGDQALSGEFYEVRLSLKGISILGSLPTALTPTESKEPMISKIRSTLAAGSKKVVADAAKTVVSEIFKLSIKYALSSTGVSQP